MDEELGRLLIQFWLTLTLILLLAPTFGCRAAALELATTTPPKVVGVRIPWLLLAIGEAVFDVVTTAQFGLC